MENTKPLSRGLPRYLTDADVEAVRTRRAAGESQSELAKAFGVSPSTISRIVNAKRRVEPLEGVA